LLAKICYENATTAQERNKWSEYAANLRKNNPGKFTIMAGQSITDFTYSVYKAALDKDLNNMASGVNSIVDGVDNTFGLIVAIGFAYITDKVMSGEEIGGAIGEAFGLKIEGNYGGIEFGEDDSLLPLTVKEGNFVKLSDNYLTNTLKLDPEEIKADIVGKNNISKYDLYENKNTGGVYVFKKGGSGEGQPTGIKIK